MSPSGSFLEKYKIWYLEQPKLLRIALLPAFVAILANALQLLSIEQQWKTTGLWFLGILLVVVAYNQLIEADTLEEYRDKADEMELDALFWKKMYGDATFLNKLYSELVLRKSEMWRDATSIAVQEDAEKAKTYIRKENSLGANINCGFNRWMQRFGKNVVPVFRSLVFSAAAHSISWQWHSASLVNRVTGQFPLGNTGVAVHWCFRLFRVAKVDVGRRNRL